MIVDHTAGLILCGTELDVCCAFSLKGVYVPNQSIQFLYLTIQIIIIVSSDRTSKVDVSYSTFSNKLTLE